MKKRLFCLLVAIAMLSSSIAAYATEPEKRATTEGEGSEKGVDELEEDGIRETEKTPDVIPETNEEADQVPEETKTPDVEVEATASPDTVPTVEPEEEAGAEPTEMPVVIPSEKPETVPEVEQTVSPSPTLLPQESALPEADAVVDATPSPSMSPTPSASPTASPVALVPEDEFVGATGDLIIDQTITLTENRVVNGNLIVNSRLNLGNYKIEVSGDVIANGAIFVDTGILVVHGNYRQEKNGLNVKSGRVDIQKDLRIQTKNAEGNYAPSSGYLDMDEAGGRLNIDGDFIMQTSNSNNWCGRGTMTLKGNFIQMSVGGNDYFDGYAPNGFKLIMAGSSPQKISLASRGSKLGNIQLDNQNIIVEGYMNATLVSDGAIKAADSGRIDVTELKLNNHQLEVLGNVVASGDVEMGGTNGYLKVTGNYVQASGRLRIGSGRMDVTGDLRMQAQDANGNYDVGSGYLEMSEDSGRLNVDGNIVIQSAKNTNLYRGTITLLGNMTQSSSNGAVGYIYSNETHRVILANANSQSLLFDNRSSKVGTLQLTRNKSSYRFGFEPCWIKLISWPFSDVTISEGNWKYESVKYVYDNNIMNGINGTTRFDPDEPLTRAMFATVLYRMAGNPPVQFQNKFEDVVDGRYYSRAVIWAYNQGIVNGVEGGIRYGIDEYITREQIAKMLKEYGRVRNYTMNESANLNSFPDRSEISGWAAGYMQWAVGSGMVTGKNINGIYYLDPKGNATRAECAAMLTRFMQRY